MNGRLALIVLFVVIGAALRVFRLDHQSLWWDEAWQYYVCAVPDLGTMFERLLDPTTTASPPGSHLVSHLFLKLGRSDVALRLPSVLLGVATLPMLYLLGRRLVGRTAATAAVAVMALSPYHVHYSQEARMYALLMFIAVTSTWLLLRAVERGRVVDWVWYSASIAVAIYTHVWASLGILSHAIWVIACAPSRAGGFVASGVGAVVAFSPMLRFFLARVGMQKVPHGGAGSALAALPYTLFVYAVGFSLGPSVFELRVDRSFGALAPYLPVVAVTLLLFAALVVVGIVGVVRGRRSDEATLTVLGLVLPIVGVFAASFLPSMTFNVRYTSWAFPFFSLIVGAGIAHALRHRPRVATSLVAAVFALFVVSLVNHYTNDRYAKEDVRAAVERWRDEDRGGVFFSYYGFPTADRYMTPEEIERHHPIWARSNTAERIRDVIESSGNSRDAFVLLARDWRNVVETFARREFEIVDEWQFRGGVRLLRLRVAERTSI